jgi:SAM-dependent methyltransferase
MMTETTKHAVQTANDSIWDSYYRSYQNGSLVPGVRYPNEHLVRFMADWKRSGAWPTGCRPRILEFGFGTVTNMAMMARFDCDVEGLEVSANTTERAREAIANIGLGDVLSVETYEGGAVVPRETGTYDAVVGLQCVYYNLDQAAFAAECARLLKPGGLLFLSFFSPRHGYMQHIEGRAGGPVRFCDGHPNPRLVGLNPYLYRDEAQFEETYGKHFEIKVGLDEFDLLPVFQSWYYLRGQKRDAAPTQRMEFHLSMPEAGQAPALAQDPGNASELLTETVRVWSGFTAAIPDEEPFPGQKYPDEQIVRFLATWKRREHKDYFVAGMGGEADEAQVQGMKALELNPLNPVHLEAMQGFGYEPHAATYMPATLEVTRGGLTRMGMESKAQVAAWDGVMLPYADGEFSAVVSAKAAYYQPNQREFLREVARVTRPGGEIFLFYLSPRHGYCRWLEQVSGNVHRFGSGHPNKALVGAAVFFASPEALTELWSPFFDVRVNFFEYSTYKVFSSFYVVTGRRLHNR